MKYIYEKIQALTLIFRQNLLPVHKAWKKQKIVFNFSDQLKMIET